MSTRLEASFLRDRVNACQNAHAIVADTGKDGFLNDQARQAAVLHHLSVIGEASNRLSPELRKRQPDVPGYQIIAVRNRIVHAYFDLEWKIFWIAATEDLPVLRRQIQRIILTEVGAPDPDLS